MLQAMNPDYHERLIPIFLLFFTFMIFLFMVFRITKNRSSIVSSPNLPPGPWELPIIGNLHHLLGFSLPHRRLRKLAEKYGPLMRLKLGEVSFVVFSSPAVAKEMFRTHDASFTQRFFGTPEAKLYTSVGILSSPYGEYWRQLRRVCTQELLSPKRVQSFRWIREEEVSNMIENLYAGKLGFPVNLSENLFSLTYSITTRAAFGKRYKEQDAFIELVKEALRGASGGVFSELFPSQSWLHWIIQSRAKAVKMLQKIDEVLEKIINEYKADKATRKDKDVAMSLLDVLFNLQQNGDHGHEFSLETQNIKAVILDIFVAGGETSSTVAEWAMAEMMKNPRVMEKAQAEVRRVFGKKGNVDETNLPELEYLNLVVKETMRLHPHVVLIPRECTESCVINGFQIPAKCKVIVNTWAMGRDPKYWPDQPEKFCPERFVESSVDFKGNDFEFIPFGAGKRMCPGIAFAIADVKLPLAQLLFHFDWKLPGGIGLESLDMNESFGLSVKRKGNLHLIPIPHKNLVGFSLLNKAK